MLMLGPPPGGELSAGFAIDRTAVMRDPTAPAVTFDPTRPQLPQPSTFPIAPASTTSMLPWLIGAGVLAYLLFFRKKS